MKKPNMTKIEQIEHFQTCVHRFSLLMPIGDFHHHHTLYIMYASRFKSPKKSIIIQWWKLQCTGLNQQYLYTIRNKSVIMKWWKLRCTGVNQQSSYTVIIQWWKVQCTQSENSPSAAGGFIQQSTPGSQLSDRQHCACDSASYSCVENSPGTCDSDEALALGCLLHAELPCGSPVYLDGWMYADSGHRWGPICCWCCSLYMLLVAMMLMATVTGVSRSGQTLSSKVLLHMSAHSLSCVVCSITSSTIAEVQQLRMEFCSMLLECTHTGHWPVTPWTLTRLCLWSWSLSCRFCCEAVLCFLFHWMLRGAWSAAGCSSHNSWLGLDRWGDDTFGEAVASTCTSTFTGGSHTKMSVFSSASSRSSKLLWSTFGSIKSSTNITCFWPMVCPLSFMSVMSYSACLHCMYLMNPGCSFSIGGIRLAVAVWMNCMSTNPTTFTSFSPGENWTVTGFLSFSRIHTFWPVVASVRPNSTAHDASCSLLWLVHTKPLPTTPRWHLYVRKHNCKKFSSSGSSLDSSASSNCDRCIFSLFRCSLITWTACILLLLTYNAMACRTSDYEQWLRWASSWKGGVTIIRHRHWNKQAVQLYDSKVVFWRCNFTGCKKKFQICNLMCLCDHSTQQKKFIWIKYDIKFATWPWHEHAFSHCGNIAQCTTLCSKLSKFHADLNGTLSVTGWPVGEKAGFRHKVPHPVHQSRIQT